MSLKRLAESECDGQPATKKNSCAEEDSSVEQSRLEAKREYNRINAARARKRTKDHIAELCGKVQQLEDKRTSLEEHNKSLEARIAALIEENKALRFTMLDMMGRRRSSIPPGAAFFPSNATAPQDKFGPHIQQPSMLIHPPHGSAFFH